MSYFTTIANKRVLKEMYLEDELTQEFSVCLMFKCLLS